MEYASSTPQAVFGLQIQDARMARLTRRVLVVSVVSGILAVIHALWSSGGEPAYLTLLSIFFALLVPACGYFGAKKSDETLTCCFCGCNLCSAVLQIMALVLSFVGAKGLEYIANACKDVTSSSCEPIREQFEKICQQDQKSYDNQECYKYIETTVSKLNSSLGLAAIVSLPAFVLYCMGFCWGNQLYQKIKQGHVVVPLPQTAAPMSVRAVQPVPGTQYAPSAGQAMQPGVQPSAPPASFRQV